jgi:hypothetical protein
VGVGDVGDEDGVQDRGAVLRGRVATWVDPACLVSGDVVPDEGWLKVVEGSSPVESDAVVGTALVRVSFVEGTPGGGFVDYVAGRETLTWRPPDGG